MRKLNAILLGLMLMAGSAYAQSASEIFAAVGKIPTAAEITTAVKAKEPFAVQIKSLNGPIEKMEKAMDDINSGKITVTGSGMPNMQTDPDGWEKAMSKLTTVQEKMISLNDVQMHLMTIHGKYANMMQELDDTYENDPVYLEKYSILQSKSKITGNPATDLANVNQFFRDVYALDCEESAKKIDKRMEVIRQYYKELMSEKARIIELDEITNEMYTLMGNNAAVMTNPVRSALVEFAKFYRRVLEEDLPRPLQQYKSMKEYNESAG